MIHRIHVGKNERGWDYRRLLGPWAAGAASIEIWEPYLRDPFQREHLAHCLDAVRAVGIPCATVCTKLERPGEGADDGPAMLGGLESIIAAFAPLGLRVEVRLHDFHRRRFVLGYAGARQVEVWSDLGLHFFQRPRNDAARASMAARATLENTILITEAAAPGQVPARAPPDAQPIPRARIRRLLCEVARLRLALARGTLLNPSQLAKLGREGPLRAALAERTRGPGEAIGAAMGDWACPNPLCDADNLGGRVVCRGCRLPGPPGCDAPTLRLWRRCISRRWPVSYTHLTLPTN